MTTDKHSAEIVENIRHGISANSSIKHNLSRQHFWAARFFSEESHRIENIGMQGASDNDIKRHRAYVVGAIFSTIAALEASINELYLEAVDKSGNALLGLTYRQFKLFTECWAQIKHDHIPKKYQLVRGRILNKYQLALSFVEADIFSDMEDQLYKDVNNLMQLRNALVHYKSQWDYEKESHHNLESKLQGKFPLNALSHATLWFPHRCLWFGCAKWGLYAASKFMNEFCKRMHIPDRFNV